MKNELVSVVVPVYNAEQYLLRLLNCLVKQSYKNLEIIVVNDGSTDNSLDILKSFAETDRRIKIIEKQNGGVSAARNTGISAATGKYLMFADADDVLAENAIEICIRELSNTDGVRFCFKEVDAQGNEKMYPGLYNLCDNVTLERKKIFTDLIKGDISGHCWCFLYKTSIVKDNNILFEDKMVYGEDYLFVLEYIKHIDKLRIIGKALYFYYTIEDSATHGLENKIRNIKSLPSFKEKVVKVIEDTESENYLEMYNHNILKLLVFYYSTFAKTLSYKEFKVVIKNLNITEIEIFNSIDLNTLGRGSKIFVLLNIKNRIRLLYIYLMIFNKLNW